MKNRVIAGVAVLAVVLALVGLAVVAGRGDGSTREPATLPVLGAGGEKGTAMADSSMRIAPVTYEAGKLPGLADEADAWKLPAPRTDEGAVADLAHVLGVEGQVSKTDYGWTVGTDAKRLDVQGVAGMPWSLYQSVPGDTPVASSEVECIKAPCTTVPVDPSCAADACDQPMLAQRPDDLPTKAEAEAQGRALLTRLGVDLDQAEVRVDDGVTVWNVSADPVVGGLPTIGFTTSVAVGPKGVVQYANGWLGEPAKGDRYPLIGTAAALQRLNDEQARLLIAPAPDVRCEDCIVDPAQPAEPRVVHITGVRLGLQVFSTYEPGAEGYLVPTYLFGTDDGGDLPVIAVADEYLGTQPTHEEPEPGTPAEPGATGQCSANGTTTDVTTQLSVQVCGPTTAKVGEPVTFTVSGKGTLRDDCGSPIPEWGDGSEVAVCEIACESLPTEPQEIDKRFEHTYAEAGTYTVLFHFKGCGADMAKDQTTLQTEVRVEG